MHWIVWDLFSSPLIPHRRSFWGPYLSQAQIEQHAEDLPAPMQEQSLQEKLDKALNRISQLEQTRSQPVAPEVPQKMDAVPTPTPKSRKHGTNADDDPPIMTPLGKKVS